MTQTIKNNSFNRYWLCAYYVPDTMNQHKINSTLKLQFKCKSALIYENEIRPAGRP